MDGTTMPQVGDYRALRRRCAQAAGLHKQRQMPHPPGPRPPFARLSDADCITLPSGRAVTLATYARARATLVQLVREGKGDASIRGFDAFPLPAEDVLRQMRLGLHDRISRHMPHYARQGRKWSHEWQTQTWRAARDLNTPRLVIRWLPHHLATRFAHRIERGGW
jgi:hypothetical protein